MTKPFDDVNYSPPSDLTSEERREYELAVIGPLREHLMRENDQSRWYESIELEGDYPDTVIVLTFREGGRGGRLLRAVAPVWTFDGVPNTKPGENLGSAPSLAASIYSSILASEYEVTEVS